MPNFPASLDALANPSAGTYMDDPGFELDLVIGRLNDIAEALEAKLGVGGANQAPVAGRVLAADGTGTSSWRQLATADIAADAVTQIAMTISFTGSRTTGGSADIDSTNGKVTLTTGGGDLVALCFGDCSNSSGSVAHTASLRLDAGADVATRPAYSYIGMPGFPVPFCVGYLFTGVTAGSHTVYARHNNASVIGTLTTYAQLLVWERKR